MTLYRIRYKETGKFYTGSGRGGLSGLGYFTSKGAGKSSMSSTIYGARDSFDPSKHEVVECEIIEKGVVK